MPNPVVYAAVIVALVLMDAEPKYPDVVTEPLPICKRMTDAPFVLTPLSITVIFLAQLGIPVKSMLVPEAVTAVARVSNSTVPVAAGKVTVLEPATKGADSVIAPEVSPVKIIDAILNHSFILTFI
jgi:hypothetical protein